MFCLVFQQTLKSRILTRTAQQCGRYGGQRLGVFFLTYSLINFRNLSFSGKKLLYALNEKFLTLPQRQVDNSSKSDYN